MDCLKITYRNETETPFCGVWKRGEGEKERKDPYDYGARFYDPQTGRFFNQDRFAEKYFSMSPYQYGANNPIYYVDINGDSIVSITRQDNQVIIENSPSEEGGENFNVTLTLGSGVDQDHVTDYSAGVINDALVTVGDSEVTVTSGYRSPEKQANAMYNNLENGTVEGEKQTYGSYGDKVIDTYVDAKGKTDKQGYKINSPAGVKLAMTSKIKQLGPGNVSKHSSDPKVYNVIDIAPSTVSDIKTFHNTLKADTRVNKVLSKINKPAEKAVHIEISQKKK